MISSIIDFSVKGFGSVITDKKPTIQRQHKNIKGIGLLIFVKTGAAPEHRLPKQKHNSKHVTRKFGYILSLKILI